MTDVGQSLIPLVKQQTGSRVEILVKDMNSIKEVNLSIKEHLLTSETDMVECLGTDPSKVILLKFYLGNTEDSLMLNQSNKFQEFLGLDPTSSCHVYK